LYLKYINTKESLVGRVKPVSLKLAFGENLTQSNAKPVAHYNGEYQEECKWNVFID
jgi:hypothetical protein